MVTSFCEDNCICFARACAAAALDGSNRVPFVGPGGAGETAFVVAGAPIEPFYNMRRGFPVDRYYIEGFLAEHAQDIYGRVLEIADNKYT